MDFITVDLQNKVKELLKLLTRSEDIDNNALDKALRLLRQSANVQQIKHTSAIKQRIRQSILTNTVTGNSGPAIVSAFEKECEILCRMNSPLIQPFLALIEPLSYSLDTVNKYNARINTLKTMDPSSSSNNRNNRINTSTSNSQIYHNNDCKVNDLNNTSLLHIQNHLPSMSLTAASVLLPIVPPYHTSGVDIDSAEAQIAWVSNEIELKLLKDLLYVFQVRNFHFISLIFLFLLLL